MDKTLLGSRPGIWNYINCVIPQFLKMLLDWLSITMLLPLLAQYFHACGGNDMHYSISLTGAWLVRFLVAFVFGGLHDKGLSMKTLYVVGCVFAAGGALWYAAIDAFVLQTPIGIIVAIGVNSVGASTTPLYQAYLLKACTEHEFGRWIVFGFLSRTAALFGGPLLTIGIEWVFNATLPDQGGSFLGAYALPGTALALAYLVLIVAFYITWKDAPQSECLPQGECTAKDESVIRVVWGFAKSPHAIALLLMAFCVPCCACGLEVLTPIYAWHQFGWSNGTGGGAILSAISVAVLINQIIVGTLTKYVPEFWLIVWGCAGACLVMLIFMPLWSFFFGLDVSVSQATARSYWLLLVAPIVLYEGFVPLIMAISPALWGRLVREGAPRASGSLIALRSGITALGAAVGPFLIGLLYNGGIPYAILLTSFLLTFASGILTVVNWKKLKPQQFQ